MALHRAALVSGEPVSPAQCLAVGDTPHDAEGAHAAGIACVGVAATTSPPSSSKRAGRTT
ncbi:MAG: hypothetical protein DLM61_12110 [Pseudonocardiales bacterium]|nr:HAD hydrolase-like protein [Pseudonocardiales bacterium]PZS29837.1 MAG: hypothetical protein DLM61_12110 [Pseudonocardiales bacterium]